MEFDNAVAQIYELMQTDIAERSAISDELEILTLLIKDYEVVHHPICYPNPIETIKFPMKQMNTSGNKLSDLSGSLSTSLKCYQEKEN
jgi:HTH-type transcriptional regulator/antitoxin HigA